MAPAAASEGVVSTPPPDGDVDRGVLLLAVVNVSTAIALLAVAMRMFVRIRIVKSVGPDDYTMLASAAFAVIAMAFVALSVAHGEGRHMFYLDDADVVKAAMWTRASISPNLASSMLARVSFCLFLLRIVGRMRRYQIFLWAVIVVTFIATSAAIINLLVSCRPLEKLWDSKVAGVCSPPITTVIVGSIQSSTAIASDWLVALFPILILKNLNMARKTKVALCALMGMGIFVGVAALVKTLQIHSLGKRIDVTWDTTSLGMWSVVEQNVSIIAVCVPAIRPLFSRIFTIGSAAGQRPHNYRNYDLSNMAGKSGGPPFPNAVTTVSAKTPALDDNGSESSLVKGTLGKGITKTLSVSLHSTWEEPDVDGRRERVKDIERAVRK